MKQDKNNPICSKAKFILRRREELQKKIRTGLALFIGNNETPMNYPANTYHFRQDSDFLYFFGLDIPGLTGVIDFDSGKEWIFGNDFDIDDIIWMGPQPTVRDLALKCGIINTAPLPKLEETVSIALSKKRKVHFLPPYRGEIKILLGSLLKENPCQMKTLASPELIRAVVSMRSIKEKAEIEEIEKAVEIAYEMHVAAMKMCRKGCKGTGYFRYNGRAGTYERSGHIVPDNTKY